MYKVVSIVLFILFIAASAVYADCPSGYYPCTIGNIETCCKANNPGGVRGDLDGSTDGYLAQYSCQDMCARVYDSCVNIYRVNPQTCANNYSRCLNNCNYTGPEGGIQK